ncbi:unnamed protein product [Ascophyllum nodosum]
MIFFSNHARRWSRMGRLEHSNTGTTRKTLETTETAYHPRLYLYRSKISKIYFHQQRPSRGSQPASQRLVRDSTGVYLPRRRWPYGERRIGVVVEHITARAEWNANSQTPAAALPSPVHQGCKSTHRGLAQEHAKERDVGVKGFCRPVLHALTLRFCFHFIFRLSTCSNATYLEDSSARVEGLKFYGTPWTNSSHMGFSCKGTDLEGVWSAIPEDVDVLLTHMPPYNVLDLAFDLGTTSRNDPCSVCGERHRSYAHWGSWSLTDRVARLKPKVHVFGHVHNSHGIVRRDETIYINAAQDLNPQPIFLDIWV